MDINSNDQFLGFNGPRISPCYLCLSKKENK